MGTISFNAGGSGSSITPIRSGSGTGSGSSFSGLGGFGVQQPYLAGSGYSIVQPDEGGPFEVIKPDYKPTSKSSSQSDSSSGSKQYSKNTTGTTKTNQNISRSGTTDNMDLRTRSAYNRLLTQLQGGGTQSQQAGLDEIFALLERSRGLEQQYTPDAARAQAQESMPRYARQLREQIMPTIYGAQEGAGLSGDAITALLGQDQATRVAESAASSELAAIQAYGQLAQGQQGIGLAASELLGDDPIQQALQSLLQIGKGSYQETQSNERLNSIITESLKESGTESSTNQSSQQAQENTAYQNLGAGGGFGGGFGTSGSSMRSSGKDEDLAMLLASLGPFQNLSDLGAVNRGGSFNAGARESGRDILSIAETLGLRL